MRLRAQTRDGNEAASPYKLSDPAYRPKARAGSDVPYRNAEPERSLAAWLMAMAVDRRAPVKLVGQQTKTRPFLTACLLCKNAKGAGGERVSAKEVSSLRSSQCFV